MPKKDLNQIAAHVTKLTTGDLLVKPAPVKNAAAVALGRLGGLKGGNARAAALTDAMKKEIAQKAAKARWDRKAK